MTADKDNTTLGQRILIIISHLLLSAIFLLNRKVFMGLENMETALTSDRPVYIALWHSRLFYSAWFLKRYSPHVLVSKSRDGDLITGVLRRWKFKPIRGSSHRGGDMALRGIVRALGDSQTVLAVTMDGPTGPPHEAKVGSVAAGLRQNSLFVPLSAASTRRKILKSWDSQHFPKPFGKVIINIGTPISFDREINPEIAAKELSEAAVKLEQETDGIAANLG